jgi:hypothetical protein
MADQSDDPDRPFDVDVRRVEKLSERLKPLWSADRTGAKLNVAAKLREFLSEHHATDDRLGEVLAVMAWRSRVRSYPDGAIPTQSTLCRQVLGIPYRRANALAHAIRALDSAKVAISETEAVLRALGGIEAATKATKKEVKKARNVVRAAADLKEKSCR